MSELLSPSSALSDTLTSNCLLHEANEEGAGSDHTLLRPLLPDSRFAANPDLYDYVHTLYVSDATSLEMIDGAGQRLFTLVQCRFVVEALTKASWRLSLTHLVEINPYYKLERFRGLEPEAFAKAIRGSVPYGEGDVRSRPAPMSLQVTQKTGLFALRVHIIWNLEDDQEWPYLPFRERYRFSIDPLAAFKTNRSAALYTLYFANGASGPDTQVYYRMQDVEKVTAREFVERGIATRDDAE